MSPCEFLWPHTITQGPFDKPKQADQLDGVGEVPLAWAETAQAERGREGCVSQRIMVRHTPGQRAPWLQV